MDRGALWQRIPWNKLISISWSQPVNSHLPELTPSPLNHCHPCKHRQSYVEANLGCCPPCSLPSPVHQLAFCGLFIEYMHYNIICSQLKNTHAQLVACHHPSAFTHARGHMHMLAGLWVWRHHDKLVTALRIALSYDVCLFYSYMLTVGL